MANKDRINHIVSKFRLLAKHEDMIKFIIEIRDRFNLEKLPFKVTVGTWSSGSLDKYYAESKARQAEIRFKKKRKAKRKSSAGWKRY